MEKGKKPSINQKEKDLRFLNHFMLDQGFHIKPTP